MDDAAPPSPSEGRDTIDTADHSDPNLTTTAPTPTTSLPFSSPSPSPSTHPFPPASSSPSPSPSPIPSPSSPSFSRYFSIPSTVAFILAHNARHVALQFPDHLLPLSSHISHLLSSLLPPPFPPTSSPTPSPCPSLYILADTSYSPCCVDLTAAQHCQADVIVHYGLACLSSAYPLPVHFVFGQADVDVQALYDAVVREGWGEEGGGREEGKDGGEKSAGIGAEQEQGVLVFCDVEYEWKMEELKVSVARGRDEGRTRRPIVVATVQPQPAATASPAAGAEAREEDTASTVHTIAGHVFRLPPLTPLSSFQLLFIGSPRSPMLTNLLLTYNSLPAYTFDPSSPSPSIIPSSASAAIRRTLSRRYYLTQHSLSASTVGLVVATLSHTSTLPTLAHLTQLIRASGKKVYTVVVGKLNPSKLANFADVDVWCTLSCPYSALQADAGGRGGYFREVLTPMELEMGLKGLPWTGRYVTDMRKLGVGGGVEGDGGTGAGEGEGDESEGEEEGVGEVVFDSATGKLRAVLPSFTQGGTAVIARESGQVVRSATGRERSWKGLETEHERRMRMKKEAQEDAELTGTAEDESKLDERIAVSLVEAGLEGIASRYTKETGRGVT